MTLVNLIKALELYFQSTSCLYTSYTKSQRDPVKLKSLKIKELRDYTSGKKRTVTVLLEGVFKGDAPHKCDLTDAELDDMGFASISIGMGAFSYDNGTTVKGMSVVLNKKLVEGSLARELETYRKASQVTDPKVAMARVKQSAAYKKAASEMLELEKITAKARSRMDTLQERIRKLNTKAVESARLATKKKIAPFEIIVA